MKLPEFVNSGVVAFCVLAHPKKFAPFFVGFVAKESIATGGPTVEQFWASYNGKYGTNYSAGYQPLDNHFIFVLTGNFTRGRTAISGCTHISEIF